MDVVSSRTFPAGNLGAMVEELVAMRWLGNATHVQIVALEEEEEDDDWGRRATGFEPPDGIVEPGA